MDKSTLFIVAPTYSAAGPIIQYAGHSEAKARKAARAALNGAGSTLNRVAVRCLPTPPAGSDPVAAYRRARDCAAYAWPNPGRAGVGRPIEVNV